MKINQIILSEMATTAGSVASVAKPMGETQKRPTVRGLETVEKVISNKLKKKGPYANSLSEGKVKQLNMDLRNDREGLTDIEFKKKYGKSKAEVRKEMQSKPQKPEPVQEAKLDEDDLVIVPGRGMKRKTGFVPHGQSRVDHEVEMAKSDLLQLLKNTKTVMMLIKDRSEDEGLEGWVQEKIIKASDYMNTLAEYLEGKSMQEMSGGVIAGGGVGEGVAEGYSNTTFNVERRKLNVTALIQKGAIFVTYPHGEQGWETDNKEDWAFSLLSLYNVLQGGWSSEAKNYLKPESYRRAEQQINSSAPNLGSDKLVYDGKYNQILWSIKKLGIPDNVAFLDKVQQGVAEGAKVDRMVKHIASSERSLGHSKKEAENIAWATANKRGYLDNKNKK